MARISKKVLDEAVSARRPAFEAAIKRLVEIPSVSMQAAAHHKDIRACAEAALAMIEEAGAKGARLVETRGFPAVVGMLEASPTAPTVTIYNHIDVQPADKDGEGWKREPFQLSIEGDRYFGRGATDDKGPGLAALEAAKLARAQDVPLNIQFLWESEEEIGSPHFSQVLEAGALRPTDSVLVSDTIWVNAQRPALSVGLRGLAAVLLRLETGTKDVHSGLTGGAARNPLTELCEIVARCVDAKSGDILVPGFLDDVAPLTEAEKRGFVESGFSVEAFQAAHGLKSLRSTDPADVSQRIWARPTFEVHGLKGGYQGEGVKTVVPPKGELKVSMRLVPNQDPERAIACLTKHVKNLNPDVEVVPEGRLRAYRTDPDDDFHRAAMQALEDATGTKPALVREGGSIGAVLTMKERFGKPIVFMGLSLPEHGYHAPNEFFDWGQAEAGMKAFVRYFEAIAQIR
jgi:acetylornithine deacetylase/succinyl-diaminopimelate desuccinylase-like protein